MHANEKASTRTRSVAVNPRGSRMNELNLAKWQFDGVRMLSCWCGDNESRGSAEFWVNFRTQTSSNWVLSSKGNFIEFFCRKKSLSFAINRSNVYRKKTSRVSQSTRKSSRLRKSNEFCGNLHVSSIISIQLNSSLQWLRAQKHRKFAFNGIKLITRRNKSTDVVKEKKEIIEWWLESVLAMTEIFKHRTTQQFFSEASSRAFRCVEKGNSVYLRFSRFICWSIWETAQGCRWRTDNEIDPSIVISQTWRKLQNFRSLFPQHLQSMETFQTCANFINNSWRSHRLWWRFHFFRIEFFYF